jgi:hypothetical protein
VCDEPDPGNCAPPAAAPTRSTISITTQRVNLRVTTPARSGHGGGHRNRIFYNYDSLSAGLITQWHQSDWEQVSILIQRKGSTEYPVEVAFSEHC